MTSATSQYTRTHPPHRPMQRRTLVSGKRRGAPPRVRVFLNQLFKEIPCIQLYKGVARIYTDIASQMCVRMRYAFSKFLEH